MQSINLLLYSIRKPYNLVLSPITRIIATLVRINTLNANKKYIYIQRRYIYAVYCCYCAAYLGAMITLYCFPAV